MGRINRAKKEMGITPRSRIKGMLRQIFLKSVERQEALKRDKYTCVKCGAKQSVKKGFEVKVQVHHKKGISIWDEIIDLIYKELLCSPEHLETLCVDCHNKETHGA
jgi:5-methylcytosine-specific restriction endonuclease McrA